MLFARFLTSKLLEIIKGGLCIFCISKQFWRVLGVKKATFLTPNCGFSNTICDF